MLSRCTLPLLAVILLLTLWTLDAYATPPQHTPSPLWREGPSDRAAMQRWRQERQRREQRRRWHRSRQHRPPASYAAPRSPVPGLLDGPAPRMR